MMSAAHLHTTSIRCARRETHAEHNAVFVCVNREDLSSCARFRCVSISMLARSHALVVGIVEISVPPVRSIIEREQTNAVIDQCTELGIYYVLAA